MKVDCQPLEVVKAARVNIPLAWQCCVIFISICIKNFLVISFGRADHHRWYQQTFLAACAPSNRLCVCGDFNFQVFLRLFLRRKTNERADDKQTQRCASWQRREKGFSRKYSSSQSQLIAWLISNNVRSSSVFCFLILYCWDGRSAARFYGMTAVIKSIISGVWNQKLLHCWSRNRWSGISLKVISRRKLNRSKDFQSVARGKVLRCLRRCQLELVFLFAQTMRKTNWRPCGSNHIFLVQYWISLRSIKLISFVFDFTALWLELLSCDDFQAPRTFVYVSRLPTPADFYCRVCLLIITWRITVLCHSRAN